MFSPYAEERINFWSEAGSIIEHLLTCLLQLYPDGGEALGPGTSSATCPTPCLPSLSTPILAVQSTPSPIEDHGNLPVSPSSRSLAGSSLGSSINDLTLEAEQLERAIRNNDVDATRRLLELHHDRFSVNLHSSLLDKSSAGSASQDLEILLRRSQTLIDRLDHGDSMSSDLEPAPAVFASALHVAIEYQSLEVARLLLRYGVEPNEGGIPMGQRRGSSIASEGSGRRNTLSPSKPNSDHSSPESRLKYVPLRDGLPTPVRVVRVNHDGREVTFESEYTRDYLYSLPPLFLASVLGKTAMTRLLLKYGASSSPRDQNGITPLHLAVCQSQVSWPCVKLLLEAGARIHVPSNRGVTPCDLADSDLSSVHISLIETAFSNISAALPVAPSLSSPGPPPASSPTPAAKSADEVNLRSNILRRLQDSRPGQCQRGTTRKTFLSDDLIGASPEGSLPSRNRSPGLVGPGALQPHPDDDRPQERVRILSGSVAVVR